jgi:hypothetical protein
MERAAVETAILFEPTAVKRKDLTARLPVRQRGNFSQAEQIRIRGHQRQVEQFRSSRQKPVRRCPPRSSPILRPFRALLSGAYLS